MKIWTKCLRNDVEYKTLNVANTHTCTDVIHMLLNKFKLKNRDPNIYYLTMEITIKKSGK